MCICLSPGPAVELFSVEQYTSMRDRLINCGKVSNVAFFELLFGLQSEVRTCFQKDVSHSFPGMKPHTLTFTHLVSTDVLLINIESCS